MTKWVYIALEVEVRVPLEALESVAPGIDVAEFLEEFEDDPDEVFRMLEENLILGDAVHYATDMYVTDVEVYEK